MYSYKSFIDRPVFVGYVTAGFPSPLETISILLSMQESGVDVIELGNLNLTKQSFKQSFV